MKYSIIITMLILLSSCQDKETKESLPLKIQVAMDNYDLKAIKEHLTEAQYNSLKITYELGGLTVSKDAKIEQYTVIEDTIIDGNLWSLIEKPNGKKTVLKLSDIDGVWKFDIRDRKQKNPFSSYLKLKVVD